MLAALPHLRFEGHALVSADGMIADGDNRMPEGLRNDADWAQFQHALGAAAIVVSGRVGHETHPNPRRRRLVLTRSVAAMAPAGGNATFWNPAGLGLAEVLAAVGVTTGTVAIAGTFDVFLPHYDLFVLSELNRYVLPGGTPCFSTGHPRTVLAASGLRPASWTMLDAAAEATITHWRR